MQSQSPPGNTGTNPTNADSDGDWYGVTASFNNPTSAGRRPNVEVLSHLPGGVASTLG